MLSIVQTVTVVVIVAVWGEEAVGGEERRIGARYVVTLRMENTKGGDEFSIFWSVVSVIVNRLFGAERVG